MKMKTWLKIETKTQLKDKNKDSNEGDEKEPMKMSTNKMNRCTDSV